MAARKVALVIIDREAEVDLRAQEAVAAVGVAHKSVL